MSAEGSSTAPVSPTKLPKSKGKKLNKKLVKRKKSKLVAHQDVQRIEQISSKLITLEQGMSLFIAL